jgi:beta-lysine 5,6-aminomutase beta subunit
MGHLYSLDKKDFDKTLDPTRIKPYGDTMNDGKVQVSFTLPVKNDAKALEAAKVLAKKMGLDDPIVVHQKELTPGFTFFILYGSFIHSINYDELKVKSLQIQVMSMKEIDNFILEAIKRKLVIIGATTGEDAHTLGIDAIMNMKGFAGHYGLERFEMIDAYNLGSQISNEKFVKKAIDLKADVLLISQTVTQKNIHVKNLTNLVDLLEAEGIRDKIVLICGGSRISNELAKELGYDAGFGPGTYAEEVATYLIKEIVNRKKRT